MFAILRLKKIKSRSNLSSVISHNLRISKVENADSEKSHLNINKGFLTFPDLAAELTRRFTSLGIKPRKDAVEVAEVVLSASPEFFIGKSDEDIRNWAKKNFEWTKAEFGKNLLQFSLHLDEMTPHIHILFTPITSDGRLSMRDLYGGRDKLSKLQTRYAKEMEIFGLKRGVSGSQAKHVSIKQFYSFVEKLKKLKPKQIENLSKILTDFEAENLRELMNGNNKNENEYFKNQKDDFFEISNEAIIKKLISLSIDETDIKKKNERTKKGFRPSKNIKK